MIEIKPDDLLEPVKVYKSMLKSAFHDNATEYFDEMVKKSGINIEANREAYKKYQAAKNALEQNNKKNKSRKGIRILLIILFIALLIGGGILIAIANGKAGLIAGGAVMLALGVADIIFVIAKMNKIIKSLTKKSDDLQKKVDAAYKECFDTIAPLFRLFDYNMPINVFTKTTPLIQMDQVFDPKKYELLHEKYGYDENCTDHVSAKYVQSGSILGNPFIIEKNRVQEMYNHVYTGTLTITWTTRVRTQNGWTTQTHTQVLTATYTAPAPRYYDDTWLIYGNEAAPDLTFSRKPTINDMSDKALDKYVSKFDKTLDNKVRESVSKGGNFTRLHNTEFEACFNALDRNNETQFRLLFTPLAQKNMIELLKNKVEAYGDDFTFFKRQKLNYIKSEHIQDKKLIDSDPKMFMNISYDECKKFFVDFCDDYLRSLFFALAPVTSIPLYQNFKSREYIYKDNYYGNITKAEVESAANTYKQSLFLNPKSRTEAILKSNFVRKNGDSDEVSIRAHSFEGIDHIQLVPTMGGDGKLHNVPVSWVEYKKIYKDTPFQIQNVKTTYPEYRSLSKDNEVFARFSDKEGLSYSKRFVSCVKK